MTFLAFCLAIDTTPPREGIPGSPGGLGNPGRPLSPREGGVGKEVPILGGGGRTLPGFKVGGGGRMGLVDDTFGFVRGGGGGKIGLVPELAPGLVKGGGGGKI